MKEVWVLSVRTSLPEICYNAEDLKTSFEVFTSFETAKEALRKKLREYAFAESPMFDGKGNLANLADDLAFEPSDEDGEDGGDEGDCIELTPDRLQAIKNALKTAFSGNDTDIGLKDARYWGNLIEIEISDGAIRFRGDDDGPLNGCDPVLTTNIFNMREEKDYYLYISDLFGQGDTSELYIDLKKTALNRSETWEEIEERAKRTKCTRCGRQFDFFDAQEAYGFDYYIGYGSAHDGSHVKADLCCDCFDELLDSLIKESKTTPVLYEPIC